MGIKVWLGCVKCYDDDQQHLPDDERQIGDAPTPTYIAAPDDMPRAELYVSITSSAGVWARQSPDETPLWVASTDAKLAGLLADHWGVDGEPLPIKDPPGSDA